MKYKKESVHILEAVGLKVYKSMREEQIEIKHKILVSSKIMKGHESNG